MPKIQKDLATLLVANLLLCGESFSHTLKACCVSERQPNGIAHNYYRHIAVSRTDLVRNKTCNCYCMLKLNTTFSTPQPALRPLYNSDVQNNCRSMSGRVLYWCSSAFQQHILGPETSPQTLQIKFYRYIIVCLWCSLLMSKYSQEAPWHSWLSHQPPDQFLKQLLSISVCICCVFHWSVHLEATIEAMVLSPLQCVHSRSPALNLNSSAHR